MSDVTAKWSIPFLEGTDIGDQIDDIDQAKAELLDDLLTPFQSDSLASRPVSTPGTPGIAGRTYRATDGANVGRVFKDYGTGWDEIPTGTLEARRVVGAGGQPPFIEEPVESVVWAVGASPVTFHIWLAKFVRLTGNATFAGSTAGLPPIFTLPAGYRPPAEGRWEVPGGTVAVQASGDVTVEPSASFARDVWLDGVTFRVA